MHNSRNPHHQPSTADFQLLWGLFEITYTWPLLWMFRVTYFGNVPLLSMMQQHFQKITNTDWTSLLLQKVVVNFLRTLLIPSWALQDILPERRWSQTGALADSSTSFAEAAVKVSASRCSSPSARGYKPCNSNSLRVNLSQLLAQQTMVCPPWTAT